MIERYSFTFKDAVNRLRNAPDDSDHLNLAEEAIELGATLYDIDTVTNIFWSRYPRMAQLMARARTRRESLQGSSQLPDEVLIEIIRLAASNPKIDQKTKLLSDPRLFRMLNTYRQVCKRWRSVIDGSSALWAFLSADTGSTKVLQGAIAKSGDATAVISYGAGKMDLQHFRNMVAPQMHRCGALWVEANYAADKSALLSLLDMPCPNLEELHVSFPSQWTIEIDGTRESAQPKSHLKIWALRNNMEKIKTLSLGQFAGWGTELKLANLRELTLHGPSLTPLRLIESLAETPLLQSLVIRHPSLSRMGDDDDILRRPSVELAFLACIELQTVSASFAHTTLSKITPPSLKQLIITIWGFDLPEFSLDNVGADYRGLVHSLMEAQGSLPIPIRVGSRFQRLALSDRKTNRRFEFSGVQGRGHQPASEPRCARCIRDFTRGWSFDPSFTLEFQPKTDSEANRFDFVVSPGTLDILMGIEGVSKIQVGEMVRNTETLYRLLSRPVHGVDQSQRWPLPRLATLEIEGQEDKDGALARMLKARYAAAAPAHRDLVVPVPFSMVKLVRDWNREPEPGIAAEIRGIVGEEHFCIEIK